MIDTLSEPCYIGDKGVLNVLFHFFFSVIYAFFSLFLEDIGKREIPQLFPRQGLGYIAGIARPGPGAQALVGEAL